MYRVLLKKIVTAETQSECEIQQNNYIGESVYYKYSKTNFRK